MKTVMLYEVTPKHDQGPRAFPRTRPHRRIHQRGVLLMVGAFAIRRKRHGHLQQPRAAEEFIQGDPSSSTAWSPNGPCANGTKHWSSAPFRPPRTPPMKQRYEAVLSLDRDLHRGPGRPVRIVFGILSALWSCFTGNGGRAAGAGVAPVCAAVSFPFTP